MKKYGFKPKRGKISRRKRTRRKTYVSTRQRRPSRGGIRM